METNIRDRREALRLKQWQLAQIVGIRPETMSRIERGADALPPYVDTILAFIERFGEEGLDFAMTRRGLLKKKVQKQERETANAE